MGKRPAQAQDHLAGNCGLPGTWIVVWEVGTQAPVGRSPWPHRSPALWGGSWPEEGQIGALQSKGTQDRASHGQVQPRAVLEIHLVLNVVLK